MQAGAPMSVARGAASVPRLSLDATKDAPQGRDRRRTVAAGQCRAWRYVTASCYGRARQAPVPVSTSSVPTSRRDSLVVPAVVQVSAILVFRRARRIGPTSCETGPGLAAVRDASFEASHDRTRVAGRERDHRSSPVSPAMKSLPHRPQVIGPASSTDSATRMRRPHPHRADTPLLLLARPPRPSPSSACR